MARLQDDFLEVYNNLVELSDVVLGNTPCPVTVGFDQGMGCLRFKCQGKGVYLRPLNYYIIRPDLFKETFLLPEDYDYLMDGLSRIIKSGKLLEDRICIIPRNQGFEVHMTDPRNLIRGTQEIGRFSFASGTSRWFIWITKKKYKNIL